MPINNPVVYHPDLLRLDFADAGHTNFAGTQVSNVFAQDQHMSASVEVAHSIQQNAAAPPAIPPSQSILAYVQASGSSPNEVVTWNAVLGDGSSAIIASVIF